MSIGSQKKTVLLTGPLGTGTSTVLRRLAVLGYTAVDADEVAHAALRRGRRGDELIVALFGPGILDQYGEINRLELNRLVRGDPRAGADFRSIIEPIVRAELQSAIEEAPGSVVFIKLNDPDAYHVRDFAQEVGSSPRALNKGSRT